MRKPKPKIYPAEFKESAVKLAIESNRPMAQIAKKIRDYKNYSVYFGR